jgi:hypothetical protein
VAISSMYFLSSSVFQPLLASDDLTRTASARPLRRAGRRAIAGRRPLDQCRPRFFLPVRVLSREFRRKFLAGLRAAFAGRPLCFPAKKVADGSRRFERLVAEAARRDWVVFAKAPFGGPDVVLKYLARYTHRAAISNHRLLELKDGQVRFRWKNYAPECRWRTMTLSAVEFVRRFVMHVLPSGFVRIRHYGLLANRHRRTKLALCRELLRTAPATESDSPDDTARPTGAPQVTPARACPNCGAGRLIIIAELPSTRPRRSSRPSGVHSSIRNEARQGPERGQRSRGGHLSVDGGIRALRMPGASVDTAARGTSAVGGVLRVDRPGVEAAAETSRVQPREREARRCGRRAAIESA